MTTKLIYASTAMTKSYIMQKSHLLHTIIVLLVGCSISQSALAQTFSASGLPLTIPDPGNLNVTVTVSGMTGTVATADEVQINISIAHAWASDIVIGITPPGGSEIIIVNRIGGGANIDMISANTLSFRANASGIIPTPGLNGVIPSGIYLPTGANAVGSFSSLVGATRNGNWTIRVRDDDSIIQGALHKAEVQFFGLCTTPTDYTVTGGGAYCAGGAGAAVGLSNSESGVTYQLKNSSGNVGSPVSGTGAAISFGNQTAGTYSVEATRMSGGCKMTMTSSVTVVESAAIVFGTPSVKNASCNGGTDGSVTVSATGGTGAMTYSISPNVGTQNGGIFSNLTAQTYTFTATDMNGCTKTTTATVSQSSSITFGTPSVTNVKCVGGNSGKVIVSATGGAGSITYSISPNVGSQSPSGTFNNLTAQTYTFTATDANGCTTTTTATVGTNTNQPPTVTLTAPTNGATLVTNTTLSATASDPDGTITSVNFYWIVGNTKTGAVSRQLLGSDNTAPYTYDWLNMAGGNYNIQAEAVDDCGVTTFSSISNVNVLETFTVMLGTSLNGQTFVPGSSLTLTASIVAFTNRTITKVEFFAGNTKLGEDLTAPYTYAWNNVPAGSYYLRAVATDNLGGVWYSPYTYVLGVNTNRATQQGQLGATTQQDVEDFILYQNQPNPVMNETIIGFNLPKDSPARLTITTIDGRVIKVINGEYRAGFNAISITKADLNTSGVFYYLLETPEHKAAKKMVIMN